MNQTLTNSDTLPARRKPAIRNIPELDYLEVVRGVKLLGFELGVKAGLITFVHEGPKPDVFLIRVESKPATKVPQGGSKAIVGRGHKNVAGEGPTLANRSGNCYASL